MFAARSLKSFHIIFNGSVTDDNFGAFQYCPILAAVVACAQLCLQVINTGQRSREAGYEMLIVSG